MNKLSVLQTTENEVFIELEQIGVIPVVKKYCVTCKYSTNFYGNKIKYPQTNYCSIHVKDCSIVNPKFDCHHWVEEISKNNFKTLLILFVAIFSFTVGALVF